MNQELVHYAESSNGNRSIIDAVDPCEVKFGETYFAHMIPPFRPDHTLMLGYGWGVVADLMRKIWGSCKITAVDRAGYQKPGAYMEHKMEVMDACQFVKGCTDTPIKTRFDYIAVDLWEGEKVPDFVYQVEFAVRLREMCRDRLCINQPKGDFKRLEGFFDYGFKYERFVEVGGNRVSWWSVM